MARTRNSAMTVTITLSTTPQVRRWLEALVADGTYGKNVAEAAERLIAEKIRELRSSGLISEAPQEGEPEEYRRPNLKRITGLP